MNSFEIETILRNGELPQGLSVEQLVLLAGNGIRAARAESYTTAIKHITGKTDALGNTDRDGLLEALRAEAEAADTAQPDPYLIGVVLAKAELAHVASDLAHDVRPKIGPRLTGAEKLIEQARVMFAREEAAAV